MRQGWRASLAAAEAVGAAPPRRAIRGAEAAHLRYLARRALRLGLSPTTAARYAAASLMRAPMAALTDPGRAGAVTLAALAAPLTPKPMRRALYAG